jgi:hypothetical protein
MIKGSGLKELFIYDYLSPIKQLLNLYGDIQIIKITIIRKPINKNLQNILYPFNNSSYDKLFHLYMIVELLTGEYILIEKNENINIIKINNIEVNNKTELKIINNFNVNNINELLTKTKKKYGKELFYNYSVINNCQKFIIMILDSNFIYDIELINFIKQDTETIFRNWPTIKNISNFFVRFYSNIKIIIN